MAWTFLLNQGTFASTAESIYRIKEFLKTVGWSILSSGTGTGATYSSSGDLITVSNAANTRSWFRAKHDATGREMAWQYATATGPRIKLSPSAGFVGGSPDYQTVPSATDEMVMKGSGTDASPTHSGVAITGVPIWHCIGDAETGAWAVVGHATTGSGAGLPTVQWFFDPLVPGTYPTEDPAPFVFQVWAAAIDLWSVSAGWITNTSSDQCPGSRGPNGLVYAMPMLRYGEASLRIPGSLIDPYSGKNIAWPVMYGREGAALAGAGYKGRSSIFRWAGRRGLYGDRVTINGEHFLVVGDVLVPWPDATTVPTLGQSEINPATLTLYDYIRSYGVAQATVGSQPAIVDGPVVGTKARSFDGGDFLLGPTANAVDLAMAQGQWTIEAWVKPASLAVTGGIVSLAGDASLDTLATNFQLTLQIHTTGRLRAFWERTASGTDVDLLCTTMTALSTGTWYRVAAVKNATHVRYFVNGVFVEQVAYANNPDGGTTAAWCVGRDNGASTYLNGLIREVQVSNIARSDAAIAARDVVLLATARLPVDVSSYVGWRLGTSDLIECATYPEGEVNIGGSYTVAGTWTGYTGDGSGIAVGIYESGTRRLIATTTTGVGGTYSVAVPSRIRSHYAEARQDGTHLGRTDDGLPV